MLRGASASRVDQTEFRGSTAIGQAQTSRHRRWRVCCDSGGQRAVPGLLPPLGGAVPHPWRGRTSLLKYAAISFHETRQAVPEFGPELFACAVVIIGCSKKDIFDL